MAVDIQRAAEIDGWMTEAELRWLAEQAQKRYCIAEVGSFHGRSTRVLADHTPGSVTAIDPWAGEYFNTPGDVIFTVNDVDFTKFKVNLMDLLLRGKVSIWRGTLDTLNDTFDMIFIDGDHRYSFVKYDITCALQRIAPNGLICGHDFGQADWPGVEQAVRECFAAFDVAESIWYTHVSPDCR